MSGELMKIDEQKPKTMKAAAALAPSPGWETLNAGKRRGLLEQELFVQLVAQDEAVMALSQLYQLDLARLTLPGKPIGALLFLGPTRSGKTRAVEAADEKAEAARVAKETEGVRQVNNQLRVAGGTKTASR